MVIATIAEPFAMPQPGQAGRPNAIQDAEVAGRSIAPESVDVPLPLSLRVYSSVYPVLMLALWSLQAAKRSTRAPTCNPHSA